MNDRTYRPGAHTIAGVIRDWIHETPLSQCNMSCDTCPDWDKAYELTDLIMEALDRRHCAA